MFNPLQPAVTNRGKPTLTFDGRTFRIKESRLLSKEGVVRCVWQCRSSDCHGKAHSKRANMDEGTEDEDVVLVHEHTGNCYPNYVQIVSE